MPFTFPTETLAPPVGALALDWTTIAKGHCSSRVSRYVSTAVRMVWVIGCPLILYIGRILIETRWRSFLYEGVVDTVLQGMRG